MRNRSKPVYILTGMSISLFFVWILRTSGILTELYKGSIIFSEWSYKAAVVIGQVTSPAALICFALLATLLAIETHHMQAWLHTATTLTVVVGCCWLLKEITQIPRPEEQNLVASGLSTFSFPSTHASTIGTLAVLATFHTRRLTKFPPVAAAAVSVLAVIVVVWSRVALHVHTISDVAAGVILGVSLGIIAKRLWPRWESWSNQLLAHLRQKDE